MNDAIDEGLPARIQLVDDLVLSNRCRQLILAGTLEGLIDRRCFVRKSGVILRRRVRRTSALSIVQLQDKELFEQL